LKEKFTALKKSRRDFPPQTSNKMLKSLYVCRQVFVAYEINQCS